MSERGAHVAAVFVVLTVLVGLLVVVTAGPAGAFDRPTGQVDGVDTDSTSMTVDLQPDGDAHWEITYRVRLDSDNETEAFESLQQDIENDSTPYTDRMETRMTNVADDASTATGREMAIENVTVETRTQPDYGLVVYRFEWTNFAAVDGDTIEAGDAIDQFYLSENRSLRMRWPEGYESDSVNPAATTTGAQSVTWEGERTFDPGQPRVVVVPEGETSGTTEEPGGGEDDAGTLPLLLGVVFAAVVGGAVVWLYARREGGASLGEDDESDDGGTPVAAADDDTDDGPPPELLSNEERVLQLLDGNGGRMKQKEVAEQLDWTAAKTSQVVSDLRDDDELESFRLGRENVLTLPDVDLEAGEESDEE